MKPDDILSFQTLLRGYYNKHARDLPWRKPDANGDFDPYEILVSEVVLQQTQVNRVIPKYQSFLQKFPDLKTFAKASLSEVLISWSGLGYNRRAKYLHDAAQLLFSKAKPWKLEDLRVCKGIGYNTAAAVLVYSYSQPLVFVETNIRTVYIHHFFANRAIGSHSVADKELLPLVGLTLDPRNPREFYWALMDYGAYIKASVGNVASQSKHYATQTPFEGSLRQIRGQVVKLLVGAPFTLTELELLIKDERVGQIITSLVAEGLVKFQKGRYFLAS